MIAFEEYENVKVNESVKADENTKADKNAKANENSKSNQNSQEDRNPNLTELVYILDCSGSMSGLESDTIGGFNASIARQKELSGEARVSLVLFDHRVRVVADRIDLKEIKPLTEETYQVGGCTALLDAVGGAVKHITKVQNYMPSGYKAGHVIFTIITDGMENASTKYSYGQVKELITSKENQGWEFLFLGANIDATAEAGRIGIKADRATNYLSDSEGTTVAHQAMAEAVFQMRSCGMNDRINANWQAPVKADCKKRGKGLFRK